MAEQTLRDSLRRLKGAQKSNKGAPLYSVLVNRPLGRFFAAVAHQVGMTPNQVTAVSAVCTFLGIGLVAAAPPTIWLGVVVGTLLVLGYALDASDGQLARLRGGGSLLGEWLDHVIDSCKIATLHLAVLIMAWRHYDIEYWALVPIVFAAIYVVHFFGMLLTDLLTRIFYARAAKPLPPKTGASLLNSALKLPTDYGLLALSFFLIGFPSLFMGVYTFMALANAGYTALVLVKWARGIDALDRIENA